jgi:hypothetical protein
MGICSALKSDERGLHKRSFEFIRLLKFKGINQGPLEISILDAALNILAQTDDSSLAQNALSILLEFLNDENINLDQSMTTFVLFLSLSPPLNLSISQFHFL